MIDNNNNNNNNNINHSNDNNSSSNQLTIMMILKITSDSNRTPNVLITPLEFLLILSIFVNFIWQ